MIDGAEVGIGVFAGIYVVSTLETSSPLSTKETAT